MLFIFTIKHGITLHISGSSSLTYNASSSLEVSLGCCNANQFLNQVLNEVLDKLICYIVILTMIMHAPRLLTLLSTCSRVSKIISCDSQKLRSASAPTILCEKNPLNNLVNTISSKQVSMLPCLFLELENLQVSSCAECRKATCYFHEGRQTAPPALH